MTEIIKKGIRFIKDKDYRTLIYEANGFYNRLPDEEYIKKIYRAKMGKELDLDNPKTFNEKLQWLKLYNREPVFASMVDKVEAKKYVASIVGEKYIIPTYGVWNSFDEINFTKLPNQFVLKCSHDCGGIVLCKDKESLNMKETRKKINKCMKRDYFLSGREWPYKNIKHRIIAEQLICDDSRVPSETQELSDYKFYCFNGYVDCVMLCYDRASGDTKFYFFDNNWQLKRINKRGIEAPREFSLPKPFCLDEMFEIAALLSKGIPFVRVDLYQSDKRVFFGELTLFPQSGWDPNYLRETDLYFGDMIDLSLVKTNK